VTLQSKTSLSHLFLNAGDKWDHFWCHMPHRLLNLTPSFLTRGNFSKTIFCWLLWVQEFYEWRLGIAHCGSQFWFSLLLCMTLKISHRFLRQNICGQECMSIEGNTSITYDKAKRQVLFRFINLRNYLESKGVLLQSPKIFGWCSRNFENLRKCLEHYIYLRISLKGFGWNSTTFEIPLCFSVQ